MTANSKKLGVDALQVGDEGRAAWLLVEQKQDPVRRTKVQSARGGACTNLLGARIWTTPCTLPTNYSIMGQRIARIRKANPS